MASRQASESISSIATRSAPLLEEKGWAILDSCLSADWARTLASECVAMEKGGLLQPHCFEFQAPDGGRCEYKHPGRCFAKQFPKRFSCKGMHVKRS